MLANDIIEQSTSEWSAPNCLSQEERWHVKVLQYQLNISSWSDACPMPRSDKLIDQLG